MFVRTPTRPFASILPLYLSPPDDSGQGDTSDAPDDSTDETSSEGRTFSQADVDRLAGKTRSEGSKAARRELLEGLGVKDEAEARKIIEAHRKATEKDRSEVERATAKATEAATAAEAAKREATTARMQLKIDRALLKAGANPDRLERLSKMVFVDLDDDADDDAVSEAIESVRADFAEAFKSDDSEGDTKKKKTGPAPSGAARDGKGSKGTAPTQDALSRGRARARQYQGRDESAKTA